MVPIFVQTNVSRALPSSASHRTANLLARGATPFLRGRRAVVARNLRRADPSLEGKALSRAVQGEKGASAEGKKGKEKDGGFAHGWDASWFGAVCNGKAAAGARLVQKKSIAIHGPE